MKRWYRELIRVTVLGTIIFLVVWIIALANGLSLQLNDDLLINFLCVILYTLILYAVNSFVFHKMDIIFGKGHITFKKFVASVFSSFTSSLFCIFLLRIAEEIVIKGKTITEFITAETLGNYYVSIIITLVITLLINAFHVYKRFQENRIKEQKIIAGTASAKFESLKNQIDPHFLFNSLNVLSSLIEENPDNAQRFTTSLSKIYRYVLEQKDKELVSVEEELAFAKTYMNLLKMRFENSIFYELPQTVSSPDAKVVPLSLQLLLENTVKHNIASPKKPLRIRIVEENGYLVVQNDFQKKEVLQDRRGVGLQNIISRYAIITARKVQIEQTDQYFTVKLPILTKQITIMETSHDESNTIYFRAKKKVEEIKAFYGNLASYIVVITGLAILNIITYPEHLWFIYPAVGWGIGVAMHAFKAFDYMPFLNNDWEERKVKELMEKDKSNRWK